MEVYGGSSNASRIAGEYLYTNRVYNKNPVEQINSIKTRQIEKQIAAQDIEENNSQNDRNIDIRNQFDHNKNSITMYEASPFRNNNLFQKGLLLNILG